MDTQRNPLPSERRVIDKHGREVLTVGALRELLAGPPEEEHVLIACFGIPDADFANVAMVAIPDPEGDDAYAAVTLFAGAGYDSRQF